MSLALATITDPTEVRYEAAKPPMTHPIERTTP
jgi:hypothetical protein